jgi:hypothetical protein
MVWEADPDQVDLARDAFGIPIEELGGDSVCGPEHPAQRACQS